jgi:hypothetical protein
MLPFGVTIPATVPQGPEIPEGLMNNPVYWYHRLAHGNFYILSHSLFTNSPIIQCYIISVSDKSSEA